MANAPPANLPKVDAGPSHAIPLKLCTEVRPGDSPSPPLEPAKRQGMDELLLHLCRGQMISQTLHTACVLDVATLLGIRGVPLSAEEIAAEAKLRGSEAEVHTRALSQVLRFLAQLGVFEEFEGPKFGLTDLSQMLRTDVEDSVRSRTLHLTNPASYAACGQLSNVIARQGGTELSPDNSAWKMANKLTPWASQTADPAWTEHFNKFMSANTAQDEPAITAWPGWGKLPESSRVCDLGGNMGSLAKALKAAYPQLEISNLDVASKIANAPAIEGVAHVIGDFFAADSIPKCDVAILKHVLHNWNDEACLKILRNVAGALPAGGRLLIFDRILPEPGIKDPTRTAYFGFDVQMMISFGAKERTLQEFKDLLDPQGFSVVSVTPERPGLGGLLLEAVLK